MNFARRRVIGPTNWSRSASTAKTVLNATLVGTPTLAEDDILEIAVTAAGSTGTQAQGLLVIATIAENGS